MPGRRFEFQIEFQMSLSNGFAWIQLRILAVRPAPELLK